MGVCTGASHGRNDIYNYYGPRKNNSTYYNNSTVINNTNIDNSRNTTYVSGPRREEVEQIRGTQIKTAEIRESTSPVQKISKDESQITIYRPRVERSEDRTVRPSQVSDRKDVPSISERRTVSEQKKNTRLNTDVNKRNTEPREQVSPVQQQRLSNKVNQNTEPRKQNAPATERMRSPQRQNEAPKQNQERRQNNSNNVRPSTNQQQPVRKQSQETKRAPR